MAESISTSSGDRRSSIEYANMIGIISNLIDAYDGLDRATKKSADTTMQVNHENISALKETSRMLNKRRRELNDEMESEEVQYQKTVPVRFVVKTDIEKDAVDKDGNVSSAAKSIVDKI